MSVIRRRVVVFGGVLVAAALLAAAAEALPGSVAKAVKHSGHKAPRPAVFVSRWGNDSTCRRRDVSKPCASFERAYRLARQGDVVRIAAGRYPTQTITYDSSKTSSAGICRLTYDGDGTFTPSKGGCVTFEPLPGTRVQVGAHTTTTADLNMNKTSTIPVVSTAGFYAETGVIAVTLGRSWWTCTGKDGSDLTGCSPTGGDCSRFLCGWAKGTDVVEGGVKVLGGAYVDFRGLAIAGTVSVRSAGAHTPTDVLFDDDTAAYGYWNGSYLYVAHSRLGGFNGSQPNTFANCNHCGIYHTTVHDERLDDCAGSLSGQNTNYYCHGDGIYASQNRNLYIVADTFYDNDVFHIFFGHGAYSNRGPVTIAKNYFGNCGPITGCSAAVSIRGDTGDTLADYTVEGNTSIGGWLIGANSGKANVSLVHWAIAGNIFGSAMCPTKPPGWTGRFGVRFVNNIDPIKCRSSTGLIATGNQTIQQLGIGGGGSLWAALFSRPKPEG